MTSQHSSDGYGSPSGLGAAALQAVLAVDEHLSTVNTLAKTGFPVVKETWQQALEIVLCLLGYRLWKQGGPDASRPRGTGDGAAMGQFLFTWTGIRLPQELSLAISQQLESAMTNLPELVPQAPQALSRIYEQLLNYSGLAYSKQSPACDQEDHEKSAEPGNLSDAGNQASHRQREHPVSAPEQRHRKPQAVFYTPDAVARYTVQQCLAPLLQNIEVGTIPSIKIVDPAMGGGAFLLQALELICQRCGTEDADSKLDVIKQCLYGVDLDPTAVLVTKLSLFLACGCEQAGRFLEIADINLKCGNSLVGAWQVDFDNPSANAICPDSDNTSPRDRFDAWCAPYFASFAAEQKLSTINLFHWELEYPQVFGRENPGFDAVIGNPPWEINKPNSREFFGLADRTYWTYAKQEALQRQSQLLLQEPQLLERWRWQQEWYECFRQFVQSAGKQSPGRRPFCHQGSADSNSYKLFLELAYFLLRDGGELSFIVPAGIYADLGARPLRELFLDRCNWHTLLGMENRQGVFEIHRSFKFCIVGMTKGGSTKSMKASFMQPDVVTDDHCWLELSQSWIEKLSRKSRSILEIEHKRDLELLEKIHHHATHINDAGSGWNAEFDREFDMTNDSKQFIARNHLEEMGFRADQYGTWLAGPWLPLQASDRKDPQMIISQDGRQAIRVTEIEQAALPLYEGRMIGQFQYAQKGWLEGHGRQAKWLELAVESQRLLPQYLLPAERFSKLSQFPALKCAFLGVGAATNTRSMICAPIDNWPCGNSVPVFETSSMTEALDLSACFNSFVFDFALRCRMVGCNLNLFLIEDCPLPKRSLLDQHRLIAFSAAALSLTSYAFAAHWRQLQGELELDGAGWIIQSDQRTAVRACLDASIANLYGLNYKDMLWLLRGSCHPGGSTKEPARKGFFRVDKNKPASARHTVLTLSAMQRLEEISIDCLLELALSNILTPESEELERHYQRLCLLRNKIRQKKDCPTKSGTK